MNKNILVPVRTVLSTTATRWQVLSEIIPTELLTRAPAKNEWSAVECLQHMIDTERQAFPVRLQAFLNGQDFPGFNPAIKGDKAAPKPTPSKMAKEFTDLRRVSLELLDKVTPDDLPRKARHAELGQVTLEEMLNEWAGHDLMHLVQAERAINAIFHPGDWSLAEIFCRSRY